jgi:hypothetical protein
MNGRNITVVTAFLVVLGAPLSAYAGATSCVGDCDGDGIVTMAEVIQIVHGTAPVECSGTPAGLVPYLSVLAALRNVVEGCPVGVTRYQVHDALTVPALGAIRHTVYCDPGDVATGGGYYLNPEALSDDQLNVEVFANLPNDDGNEDNGAGWDLGIRNKASVDRNGFGYAVCLRGVIKRVGSEQ